MTRKISQKILQLLPLLPAFALPAALVSSAGAQARAAQSFQVSQYGKPVGTASYRIAPVAGGLQATSLVKVNMPGLVYSLSDTESLDAGYRLRQSQLSGIVNGSAANVDIDSVTAQKADSAGEFLVKISANGHPTTNSLPRHAEAVVLPDFDPGALEILLQLGARVNNRDIWALIPKGNGSIEPAQIATDADLEGSLAHGGGAAAPIVVHHLTVTLGSQTMEIFSSPQNHLLQAELPQQGFALVRQGFTLQPPAKPPAPPQPPVPQQQPDQPQPEQPQP